MIDVKEATQRALAYFEKLYGEEEFTNVLLEEVEKSEEEGMSYWLITIGFTEPETMGGPLSPLSTRRRYKRFKIDAETGEVVAMKIRSLENA